MNLKTFSQYTITKKVCFKEIIALKHLIPVKHPLLAAQRWQKLFLKPKAVFKYTIHHF